MKLINTDGMVFIGPGSEWLWAALTGWSWRVLALPMRVQQLQIHDNTKLLRSQAHYNAMLLAQRPWELLIENEALAGVMNVAFATPEGLSADEWPRCSAYMFMQFSAWEYFYYQHRDGSIPKELWVGADDYYKALIATKSGYARFWSESPTSFDEPFRSDTTREFAKKSAPADAASAAAQR